MSDQARPQLKSWDDIERELLEETLPSRPQQTPLLTVVRGLADYFRNQPVGLLTSHLRLGIVRSDIDWLHDRSPVLWIGYADTKEMLLIVTCPESTQKKEFLSVDAWPQLCERIEAWLFSPTSESGDER